MNLTDIIGAVQKAVGVDVDGKAGPQTWQAIYNRVVPQAPTTGGAPTPDVSAGDTKVDDRSEETIATLLPEVRPYARALINKAAATGITIKAISGLRTYAEQDELYAKGRTKPGPKVTNAPGGHSNHNFGIAFDIGVFEENKWLPESPKYKAVGALGVDLGLEWGGNWTTIDDEPHFQLRPNWAASMSESNMLAELRSRKESGTGVYV
jgi:peptidoglycan L-alanyl-D-glutamate endopeptidase CwlK